MRVAMSLALVVHLATGLAHAQERPAFETTAPQPEPLRLSPSWDGAVVAGAAATMGLSLLIPVDQDARWNRQLLPFDHRLEGRYSAAAAHVSDVLLAVDVSVPPALFIGQGMTADTGRRLVVYGETLLVSLALDSVVKPLVSRPRPYTYGDDSAAAERTQAAGRDAHLSFYSGHSSTAFAASVSGAMLFAQSTSDTRARAAVWFAELAMAAATADLRTRAGMHFYSDVLVGAAVGSAVGVAVPYFHGGRPRLSRLEWLAIVLGPVLGVALGELLPVGG